MRTRPHEQAGGLRTIAGVCSSTGAILFGVPGEFTVTKTGTGVYAVRFLPSFKTVLSVVGNSYLGGAFFASPTNLTKDGFTMQTFGQTGAATDRGFAFTAVGRV